MILEESENLRGDRIATVAGPCGEELLVNVDATVVAVVNLLCARNRAASATAEWMAQQLDALSAASVLARIA